MNDFEITAANLLKRDVLFWSNGPFFITDKETLYNGVVVDADDERCTATICYLAGVASYVDDISYEKLVAVIDPDAPCLQIENYSGNMIDLRPSVRPSVRSIR